MKKTLAQLQETEKYQELTKDILDYMGGTYVDLLDSLLDLALTPDTPTLPELEEVEEKYSLRGPLNIKEYHYNQNEMVDTINNLVAHVKALEAQGGRQ